MNTLDQAPLCPPMLAERYEEGLHLGPWWAQAKVDGVRCTAVATGGAVRLYSRQGKLLRGCEHIAAELVERLPEGELLDGELYSSSLSFPDIVAAVNRGDCAELHLVAFDSVRPSVPERYRRRWQRLQERVRGCRHVQPVPQLPAMICEPESVQAALREMLAQGWEGLILRADAPWSPGRSEDLLKLKPHCDAEFVVQSRQQDLQLRWVAVCSAANGKPFRVMVPRNVSEGDCITVRYDGYTTTGLPRFPRFVSVRNYE